MTTTSQVVSSLVTHRAQALLGDAPMLTFQCDGSEGGCSIRLVRARGGVWLGLATDRALFVERVRLGYKPRFVVNHDVATPTLSGEASVRVVGRLARDGQPPAGLHIDLENVLRRIVAREPFPVDGLVVLEVIMQALAIDEGEGAVHGAIPRT